MGSVALDFAADLRDRLGLRRAVETGTYLGDGARALATVFDHVTTVELSEELHRNAQRALADTPSIDAVQGDSAAVLPTLVDAATPTLWFLDGHWSAGDTAGEVGQCPILEELEALRGGHPDDCYLIDDARYLAAPPRPPYDPEQWPTLLETVDAIRSIRPEAHITVLDDQVIGVPPRGKPAADAHGQRLSDVYGVGRPPLKDRVAAPILRLVGRGS